MYKSAMVMDISEERTSARFINPEIEPIGDEFEENGRAVFRFGFRAG